MDYAEGVLAPAVRASIEHHVDGCADCTALVAHAAREAGVAPPSIGSQEGDDTPQHTVRSAPWPELALPARVGRYLILARVGQGGMGVVCSAYDPRLQRTVAVKLLRPDRNDRDADRRLQREARALATLSHPNVVAVFECGRLEDRDGLYVVMELVEGETLRRWVERAPRSSAEILAAYIDAARGLAAAHAAGLVHRDFKPDNVLVGADGRVRVTDFGLAREFAGTTGRSERSLEATHGTASDFAGTPTYMAPEQRDGGEVGPAADQYALCVSLWEALLGVRPPDGDVRRLPGSVRAALSRGLSADPTMRWPSIDAFVDALGRPARRGVIASGLTMLVAIGAFVLGSAPAQVAVDPTCASATMRMDATWTRDRRDAVVALADAALAPEVTTHLDAWVARWRTRAADACLREPELLRADGCLTLAAIELDTQLDVLERATRLDPVLRTAVHELAEPESCGPATARTSGSDPEAVAAVRAQLAQASALAASHRFDGARTLVAASVARARTLDEPLLAEALKEQSGILHLAGDYDDEAAAAEEAYLLAEALGREDIAAWVATREVFTSSRLKEDTAEATTWARHAQAAIDRMDPALRDLATARLTGARAHISLRGGDLDEAARSFALAIEGLERSDEVGASELAGVYNDLGTTLIDRDPDAALANFELALALLRGHYGDTHPRIAMLLNNIAGVHFYRDDMVLAERYFAEAARLLPLLLGEHHPQVGGAYMNLGMVQGHLGDEMAARASIATAIDVFSATFGPEHPDIAVARTNLGSIDLDHGDFDAAEDHFRTALAMLEATAGPDHPYCANALRGLARVELARGHAERTIEHVQRALSIEERDGLGPVELVAGRLELAEAQLAAGDRTAAIAGIRTALAELDADPGDAPEALRLEQREALVEWLAVNAADAGSD